MLLLPLIWYIPAQTATGGPLEEHLIFRWFGLILLITLFLVQTAKNIVSGKPFAASFIAKPLLALIIIAFISALLNGQGVWSLLGYLALYLQYPLFFIFLINSGVPTKVCKVFVTLFLTLIFIQIPEVIFRFLFLGIKWD